MTNEDMLENVLIVACLTNDRAPEEQRAMLALGLQLDRAVGAFVTRNQATRHSPRLVAYVEETYDPSEGKPVTLTAAQRERYERLVSHWKPCDRCGAPVGTHFANNRCPNLTEGD